MVLLVLYNINEHVIDILKKFSPDDNSLIDFWNIQKEGTESQFSCKLKICFYQKMAWGIMLQVINKQVIDILKQYQYNILIGFQDNQKGETETLCVLYCIVIFRFYISLISIYYHINHT